MIEFFLKRRVLTNLITMFIIAVGGWQAFRVRREAFPDIRFEIVTIITMFPGASPEEVETLVTRKIEEELRDVSGIERAESYSIENRSLIILRMDDELPERDMARAVNEVYQAVNRVAGLPAGAERPIVKELTSASRHPLITVSVAGGSDEARDAFAEEFKDILEELEGIARVDLDGDRDRQIWIEADPEKLRSRGVTLAELSAAVSARNLDLSAGVVEIGPRELWVRVAGKAETASDIAGFIVRANDERAPIRVRDVARVRETFEEPRVFTRAGGEPAIHLLISKHRAGDAIRLTAAVRRTLLEHAPRARALGIKFVVSDDFSFFIKRRLNVMTNNMVQGGVLVLIALFFFLDWRLAAVAAWGVPISFAAAMLVAVPLGFTINLLSLLGFIIVLGMLDDDSVVVAENIYRHLEMGKPPEQAALEGTREVILPVLGSVLVSSCAFLPFAMMTGIMGKFMFMIPVIVCMAFVASVFEAFFILPSHVIDILPFGRPVEDSGESRWYAAMLRVYERSIRWMLGHKGKFLGFLAVFMLLSVGLAYARLKLVLFPPGMVDQFFIQIDMPRGTSLSATRSVLEAVEKEVLALPSDELDVVTGSVGQKGWEESVRVATNYAQLRVFLTPEEKRPRKTREIIALLRARVAQIPGPEKVVFDEFRPGPPVGKAIQVRVRGRDPEILGRITTEIKAFMAGLDGVRDIQDSREGGKDQLRLVFNHGEAAFASMDLTRAAQSLLLAIDGGRVTEIQRPNEEVEVKVRLIPERRADTRALLGLEVPNPQGRQVSLGRLAHFEERQGPPFFSRYNFRPVVTIIADVDLAKSTSRQANAAIERRFADLAKRHPGYELIFGGEEEQTRESIMSLFKAFGVALMLDFVILAALFKSYSQPLIMLTTIPIGLLGVVYALLFHGAPASFMALLGVVAMTGVVVNNAIVLVDCINAMREEGLALREAVVRAGCRRLRPIAASSITTLLGLFPTAYGFGGYEPFVAPMALALAWGLTFAMPMTLYVIPAVYVLVEDAREFFRGLFRRVFTRSS